MTYKNFADVKANKPVKWWHEAIIDDMLAFPLDTLKDRAARLDYDQAYLCVIINSDMFKAAYAHRRREYAERLDVSLVNKTAQVAGKCLDIMLETLESKRTQIPFAALASTADSTLSRLGYGTKQSGPSVNVNVNGDGAKVAVLPTVSAEQLAEARQALRAAESIRALDPPAESRSGALLELTPEPEGR